MFHIQLDRVAFIDLWLDFQLEPHILALHRGEWIRRRPGAGGGVLARDERNILAHHDLGIFIVQGDQVRGGENITGRIGCQGIDQGPNPITAGEFSGCQGQALTDRWGR